MSPVASRLLVSSRQFEKRSDFAHLAFALTEANKLACLSRLLAHAINYNSLLHSFCLFESITGMSIKRFLVFDCWKRNPNFSMCAKKTKVVPL